MKKIFLTTILFSITYGNIFSQNGKKLNESEKQIFEQKMITQFKKVKTLQCAFMQEKASALVSENAVSKGILLYQPPSALRWEYLSPAPMALILNGNNAVLLNKNGTKIGNEKMLKQLGYLIIDMINGKSMSNSKQFFTEIYETADTQMTIVLTPVQKRLKEFYSVIELKIDAKTLLASEIILNEKSGDKTVISLINKELNKEIPQKKFEY
ncbi:MAG: outer membrane lipoprotein carrier protein LolA [Prevotellaceae bacterium]|jgi:outer membrane lipoprotein-sorting protein|nr:outer membrane lipoprotein carrier protein LolA [Prevotellaceae bacterium]